MERRFGTQVYGPLLGALIAVGLYRLAPWDANPKAEAPVPTVSVEPAVVPEDVEPDGPGEIGVRRLLEEMVDLSSLARLPDLPYVARMASSFDRRSVSPDDAGTWFANDDWASQTRPHFERIETRLGGREGNATDRSHEAVRSPQEYVLLDAQGPGALVRLWTATPTGTLRIYLDKEDHPAIEAPMADLLSGDGMIPRPFAHLVARGYNAYFPIPFRSACKVTIDTLVATDPFAPAPLHKFYYQINYRSYGESDRFRIRTFRPRDLQLARPAIARIAKVLENPALVYQPSADALQLSLVEAGDEARALATKPGGGVIRRIVLRIRDTTALALRRATLTVMVDGEITVRAPLGDFFGTGPGLSSYESLPFSVQPSGGTVVSRWPMPFRESAVVLVSQSPGTQGEISVEPRAWTEQSLYFHARWRPETQTPTRPFSDLGLLEVEGTGVYVGTMFNLTNPPGSNWWGEGDEKIRVDGEAFPSIFGTGTEDYFGYAWSTPEPFTHAFHSQTRAGSGRRFDGSFSMNRFHTLDAVPFSKGLKFDLELWHWDDTRVRWSSMTYYYARPGAKEPN